jgi:hypothetical protein
MDNTASFLALETMLRQGWLMTSFTEFKHLLDVFEQKGLITMPEHQALLVLAEGLELDRSRDPRVVSSSRSMFRDFPTFYPESLIL